VVAVASGGAEDCDPITRQMLHDRGVPFWTTAEDGAVVVRSCDGVARVTGFRSGRSVQFKPSENPAADGVRREIEGRRDG
jgi:hypothetical protein